jgi:predicted O-methyltransferase YrrM
MRLRTVLASTVVLLAVVNSGLAQPPGGQGPRGPFDPMRLPVMSSLDANGDGALSAAEIAAASTALKKLDKNGDGQLAREEMRPQFGPGGPGGPGPRGMGPGREGQSNSLEKPAVAKDDAERKILQVLREIIDKQGRRMNVPTTDGRLLRLLAEAIGAKTVVEIGTSNGISSIWMGLALQKTGGKLITHEIDPQTAAQARENFAAAGVANLITVVEGDAHQTVAKLQGPIDLVFIDADKEGYLDYLQKLLPLVRPGGLVLAHNMTPRMARPEFVKAITTNPELETLFYSEGGGVSISLKKR